MVDVIHNFEGKARKRYADDSIWWIDAWLEDGAWLPNGEKICFADGRILVRFKRDRHWACNIEPGDQYVRQFSSDDGVTYVFRAKKVLDEICKKYDLYTTD